MASSRISVLYLEVVLGFPNLRAEKRSRVRKGGVVSLRGEVKGDKGKGVRRGRCRNQVVGGMSHGVQASHGERCPMRAGSGFCSKRDMGDGDLNSLVQSFRR